MDVTPFNRLVGLEAEDPASECLVSLPEGPQYANHLGTVHASALLAVAEAGSGAFLLRSMGSGEGFVPVVRRIEAKFKKPASGRIYARSTTPPDEVARWSSELASRGRLSAAVSIEVVDAAGVVVLTALVEWFIARRPAEA
jgi:acyl-coenzyme A thioesterase PaaI-like protein